MRSVMQDEAFHEIQLNGKQLVFLFMAATVVAVVIFLCGVMVGRGVPQQLASNATELPIEASVDPTAIDDDTDAPPATSSSSATAGATPLTAGETLTYPGRLEEPTPPVETLGPPGLSRAEGSETAATSSVPAPTPPAAPAREPVVEAPAPSRVEGPRPVAAAPVPSAPVAPEPAGTGFVVQVAAVKERGEADTIARRLSGKGYPAFVTTAPGGVQMFRVRVGKFPDRREAESVAGRLQKQEQFKPWITR
jgi:cell division septation protein DedD